jgi:cell division protein FtsB
MDKEQQTNIVAARGRTPVLIAWLISGFTLLSLITSMWVGGEGAASKLGFFLGGSTVVLVVFVSSVVLTIFWVNSSREFDHLRDQRARADEEIRNLREKNEILDREVKKLRFELDNLSVYQKMWDEIGGRIGRNEDVTFKGNVQKDAVISLFNQTRKEVELVEDRRKLQQERDRLEEKNRDLHRENDQLRDEVHSLLEHVRKIDTDIADLTSAVREK